MQVSKISSSSNLEVQTLLTLCTASVLELRVLVRAVHLVFICKMQPLQLAEKWNYLARVMADRASHSTFEVNRAGLLTRVRPTVRLLSTKPMPTTPAYRLVTGNELA